MYVVRLRHSVPQALQISRSSASTEWNSVALHGRHNERSAGRGNSVGPRRCCILVAPQCSSISQCENATARNGPTEQCVCRGGARRRLAGVHRAPHSPLIPDRTASARLEFVGAVGRRSIGILYCSPRRSSRMHCPAPTTTLSGLIACLASLGRENRRRRAHSPAQSP